MLLRRLGPRLATAQRKALSNIANIGSHALAVASVNVKAYFIATKIDLNLANGALCAANDR